MRYLTGEHWAHFQDDTRKGVAFEDLVQQLLPRVIPGRWVRTKPSWDRSRDFWRRYNGDTVAAECKFYRDPISLKILSNTLVMAIIDDLARIIFFSYSRLNRNTISHLSAFSTQTGKSVEVYDDEKLEQLILSTPRARRLFPKYSGKERAFEHALRLTEHVSRDPDVEYLDLASAGEDSGETRTVSAELYETVVLDIFVTNDSLEPASGTVVLDMAASNGATLLLDKAVRRENFRIPFELGRAGVFGKRLHFKIMKSGPAVELPGYDIETKDGFTVRDLRNRKPLDVPALLRPPLIGRSYHAIQAKVRRLISVRDAAVFVALRGASGAGKSRLMDEIRDDFVAENYAVYRFRGENGGTTSFDEVVRKFLAKRFRLPLSPATDKRDGPPAHRTLESPLVHRILYDSSYCPSDHRDECRTLLFSSLADTKAALFFDDLQSFDDATVSFLSDLVSHARDTASRAALVFTVNTDLAVKGSSSMTFLERLNEIRLGRGHSPATVTVEEVRGFSPPDALSYLDHCFAAPGTPPARLFSARYPGTARLFLEHVPLNPLFIDHYLRYLLQEGIIGRDGDVLEVLDPGAFNDALRREVPGDISILLDRRWKHVRGEIGAAGEKVVDLLTLLVYLPLPIAARWKMSRPLLARLRDHGFVRIDDRNVLVFNHQLVFRYFRSRFGTRDRAWSRRVLARFDDTIRQEYPAQYLLLLEQVRSLTAGDVRHAILTAENETAALEYLPEFTDALLRASPTCETQDRGRLLKALRVSGQRLKSQVGFRSAFDALRRIADRELAHPEMYRKHGEAFMRLALACANIHVTIREDTGAIDILQAALQHFEDFRFKDAERRAELLCALLNRLCVAMRSVSNRAEALGVGARAEREAVAAHLPHMRMQAHIDIGYVFYGRIVDRKRLLAEWSRALKILPEEQVPSALITGPNVWRYHNTHVLALQGRLDRASDAIESAIARAMSELDTFHLVKLLCMDVVVELMRNERIDGPRLERVTDRVVDLCVRHDARQTYWVGLHARAKVAERRRKTVEMRRATVASFRQLMVFAGPHPEMQERYHAAILDLAIMARKSATELPPDLVARIAAVDVHAEVERVLRSSDRAFREYRRRYRPLSTYHDGCFDLPCP